MQEEDKHYTKGMRFDVDGEFIKAEGNRSFDLIYAIPELRVIPSWRDYMHTLIPRNAVARYIIYVYSFDTFLNKMQMSFPEQKEWAISKAIGKVRGVKEKEIRNWVYDLGDDKLLDMVHDYLRFQNSDTWTQIVIMRTQLDENNRLLLRGTDAKNGIPPKEKRAIRDDNMEILKDVRVLEKEFYNQFADVKDKYRKKMVTMESRAKNLLDNVEAD